MTRIAFAGGGSAGEASHLSVQAFSSAEIITAMRNGSDNLELIGWTVQDNKVTRAATASAGAVEEVALVVMGRRAVTGVRSGSKNLLLISWSTSLELTSIDRLHDSGDQAGEASHIAMAALSTTLLVTALRAGSGDLLLITWALHEDGSFTRLADSAAQAGEVSLVKVTSVGNDLVVTAVRNGSGDLELIAWKISADGRTIHRQDPGGTSAGVIGDLALTAHPSRELGGPDVITAVQNGAGDLLLISWKILDNGAGFARIADTSTLPASQRPGSASHLAIGPAGNGTSYLATMRNGSGDLELIVFDVAANGAWSRAGTLVNGAGTDVTETAVGSLFGRPVTVVRNRDFLNLAIWDLSPDAIAPAKAPGTAAFNRWFASVLGDPARARLLKDDWRKLLAVELPVTEEQREHLAVVPARDAKELQAAIALTVERGGTIHIERDSETGPGTLIVQPRPGVEDRPAPAISVGIFHCTFDANCRHWHCAWGPARKHIEPE